MAAGTVIVWDRGDMDADRRRAQGLCQGPSRLRTARRKAQRPLASRQDAHEAARKKRELVADQGRRRLCAAPRARRIFWRSVRNPPRRGAKSPTSKASRRAGRRRPARSRRRLPTKTRGKREAAATGAALDPARIKGAKKAPLPAFVEPMLASLVTTPPAGERWLHEIKFDGYRLQARIDRGEVKLLTRSGLDWTAKFGEGLAAALARSAVEDRDHRRRTRRRGGVRRVGFLGAAGRSQQRPQRPLRLLCFRSYSISTDTTLRPPRSMRARVCSRNLSAGGAASSATATTSRNPANSSCSTPAASASKAWSPSCAMRPIAPGGARAGSKRNARRGRNSSSAGYMPSTTSAKAIGSLVLGVYENGALSHVGRVGTGFTEAVAKDLFKALDRLRMQLQPLCRSPHRRRGARDSLRSARTRR